MGTLVISSRKYAFPFFAGLEKTEHWTGSWPASGLEKFSFQRIAVFCKRNPDTNKVQMNYLNIIFDPSSKEYERVTPDELGVTKSFLKVTKKRSLEVIMARLARSFTTEQEEV